MTSSIGSNWPMTRLGNSFFYNMRKLACSILLLLSLVCKSQPNQERAKILYITQIKATEALLRLNEVGEAKAILKETDPGRRGLEWQILNAMSDRSIQTFKGHRNAVAGLAISADGNWLASGSADSTIIIWNAFNGDKIATLTGHKGQVTSLDFNASGSQLLSGSTDRTIKLWDLKEKKEIGTIKKDFFRGIYQCKFSPDGKKAGIVSWEFIRNQSPPVQGFAVVLSLPEGNVVQRFNTDNHPASAVDFSGDGNKIYTATWGFHVKKHDLASGKDEWDYDVSDVGYYTAFQSCDLSPDGGKIVTGGKDNQVRMLDAATGKLLYLLEPHKGHVKWVNAVRFSGDGKLFASASDDQLVKVWETETGKLLYTFKGHTSNINGVAFSSDNKTIFSASADGTIKKWNIEKPGQYQFHVCNNGPWDIPLGDDGKWIAAACSDTILNVWNLASRTIAQSYSGVSAIAAAISKDGKYLASGNTNVEIFDLRQKKKIVSSKGHQNRITGIDWMPRRNLVATASGDGTVRIWNEKGDSVKTINTITGSPYSVVFTPDGKKMIVGMSNGKVKLYDTGNWKETDSVQSGSSLLKLKVDEMGKYILTSGDKGQLFLWNLKNHQPPRQLKGHTNNIYGVSFHPNGRYAISASYDLSVKIWDVATGECMLTLKEFKNELYTVAITSDGKKLVVSDVGGDIHIFEF